MPDFTYVARDSSGEKVTGTITAGSERDVINTLTLRKLFPVSVTAEDAGAKAIRIGGGKVNAQKAAIFYEQLSSLIANGVPLLRALTLLREQTAVHALKIALDDVIARVEEGEALADGFAHHPKVFSDMAVNMSRAGAEGGFLEDALSRVASFTEQQADLKSRTIGALIYPLVLATIGTLVVTVLIVFFVPKFAIMFEQLREKNELPAVTDMLLWISESLQSYGIFILAFFAILYLIARVQLNTERGKLFFDGLKLKVPMFGPIVQNLAVARFCRVLGTLLTNGVPILKGLDISRDAAGNRVLSQAIGKATDNITSGEALSVPLAASGKFPPTVTEMISVAEESNTLDTVLVNIADTLENRTMRRLDLMVKMIEPLMLLVMAAIVLFVVLALLLPVMKMGNVV